MTTIFGQAMIAGVFTALLACEPCQAAPPSDADLQRFLRAYPAGDLFNAGFRASVQSAGAASTAMQAQAACALARLDKTVIDTVALTEARNQFRDASMLNSITRTLETSAGKKLIESLLRVAPDATGSATFPNAQYTPEEEDQLRKFQGTSEFIALRLFAETVGPQVEKNPTYVAMMSGIKAVCTNLPPQATQR